MLRKCLKAFVFLSEMVICSYFCWGFNRLLESRIDMEELNIGNMPKGTYAGAVTFMYGKYKAAALCLNQKEIEFLDIAITIELKPLLQISFPLPLP